MTIKELKEALKGDVNQEVFVTVDGEDAYKIVEVEQCAAGIFLTIKQAD